MFKHKGCAESLNYGTRGKTLKKKALERINTFLFIMHQLNAVSLYPKNITGSFFLVQPSNQVPNRKRYVSGKKEAIQPELQSEKYTGMGAGESI